MCDKSALFFIALQRWRRTPSSTTQSRPALWLDCKRWVVNFLLSFMCCETLTEGLYTSYLDFRTYVFPVVPQLCSAHKEGLHATPCCSFPCSTWVITFMRVSSSPMCKSAIEAAPRSIYDGAGAITTHYCLCTSSLRDNLAAQLMLEQQWRRR